MTDLSTLRFFRTPAHACSYLEDHQASTLFVDPQATLTPALYSELSQLGFRRSGDYLYRPHCEGCQACIPARVRVADFHPRRRHRRILKRNGDLEVTRERAHFSRECYQLYASYIDYRHGDGDMYPPSEEQFNNFLICDWADTDFFCFREAGKLRAVAVTDTLDDGLSAVYTFFDPTLDDRSLGVMALLWQIDYCRRQGLPYLYLGYWIRQCQKMRYKSQYRPLEILIQGHWQELQDD
ncbi:arginyl-tRNA-protein transferase [Alcanivorax hongdengensis A-11-3]|uniref:Aspartate/glutamate leucyltransferase n=1 Tax=Alcanivorax hongdengensis A-11-3 TaxID=1177179 RepID=L0W9E7_9GAMM|nr:arginyltransferase [Alcanivorax hongdengensis]EKF73619.1 arginyl-tRNA-protein transferase [Alcanivorax hongdengensis A-11-3]